MRSSILKALALAPLPLIVFLLWTFRKAPFPPPKIAGKKHVSKVALLPATLGPWRRVGKLLRFDKKTLYDRIDGAAPVYLKAGYQRSLGAEYRHPSVKEGVQTDFIIMGTAKEAEAMYRKELDAKAKKVAVGHEGYYANGTLNFWAGKVYVKLSGYDDGSDLFTPMRVLAQAIAKKAELLASSGAKKTATSGVPASQAATKAGAPASQGAKKTPQPKDAP